MIYVFDTSSFRELFKHFYPSRFPSLWQLFGGIVNDRRIMSVREVLREIGTYGEEDRLFVWARNHGHLFSKPSEEELVFVKKIFSEAHFQTLISQRNISQGRPVADPFVVARAAVLNGIVITEEKFAANGAKIPNVCSHFNVECKNLEGFMECENWTF